MGGRRCCCLTSCAVFVDEFTDSASSTLSSDWTEESGDWEYDGLGNLVENGTLDACVLTTAQSRTEEQSVRIVVDSLSTGDKYRVICNAADENNYHYVEIEQKAASYVVRLCKMGGGTSSTLREDEMTPQLSNAAVTTIGICFSKDSFTATVENSISVGANSFWYECNPNFINKGKKAGIGNGGTSTITVTEFGLANFIGTDGVSTVYDECRNGKCCVQQCKCCEDGLEYCIGHELLLTIHASGGCALIDGTEVTLTYVPGTNYWRAEGAQVDIPSCWLDDGLGSYRWYFECMTNSCAPGDAMTADSRFNISLRDTASGVCNPDLCISFYDYWQSAKQCDPFELIFPVTEYDFGDPPTGAPLSNECCCDPGVPGSVWIEIVEAP